jgi:hypothetical protein
MPTIQTTYPQGGVSTSSEGQQLTRGNDLSGVLAEVLRRRLAMQQQEQQGPLLGRAPVQRAMEPVHQATPAPPVKSPLERAQEHARLVQLKAAEQGPLMHYSGSGFNLPQRLEMDDQHMNAYQRQLYLPQASGMREGGADTAGDAQAEYEARIAAQLRAAGINPMTGAARGMPAMGSY